MSLESQITAAVTRIATEFKTVRGEAARKIFPTYAALNLYSAPIGTIGYVVADESEYICRANGWNLWNSKEVAVSPASAGGATIGNGANAGTMSVSAGMATMHHKFYLGTTSVVGGAIRFFLPASSPTTRIINGVGRFYDKSADMYYQASVYISGDTVWISAIGTAGAYGNIVPTTGSIPFVWAVQDHVEYTISWLL